MRKLGSEIRRDCDEDGMIGRLIGVFKCRLELKLIICWYKTRNTKDGSFKTKACERDYPDFDTEQDKSLSKKCKPLFLSTPKSHE